MEGLIVLPFQTRTTFTEMTSSKGPSPVSREKALSKSSKTFLTPISHTASSVVAESLGELCHMIFHCCV